MDRIDVLIVTAVPEEYAAVTAVHTGAAPSTTWQTPAGQPYAVRDFEVGGGVLRIAVTQALGMGGAHAAIASADLIEQHDVRCLAMCGVIIADRVWQYDTGKRKAQTVKGKRVVKEQGDIEMHRLHPPEWKLAAERFELDRSAPWLQQRPRSYEAQGDWVLERLLRGADPLSDAESKTKCADLEPVLARLWKLKLLKNKKLELTAAGRKHIEHVLLVNRGELPEPKRMEVRVGPIASGNKVIADDEIFALLSDSVRKVLGVEMEAAAIGALAWAKGLPYSVVMKAVMDHADTDKSDNFKAFAAMASAEVLIAFVRQNVPPRATGEDPILTPGTSPLPKKHGPAALLNARHEVVGFHGRAELLEEMRRWCEGSDDVRVRLIHADGGMGKTRLAIELCKQMREIGWRAGFLGSDRVAELMESDRPVLAVIDYAESRQELREMLNVAVTRRGTKPLRILLLARNADEWWADLMRADGAVKDRLCDDEPIELTSVTPDREVIFREAVKAFGGADPIGAAPSLADKRYERVLYIHAAALATAQGRDVKIDTLMEDTLDHEERFWREQLRDRGRAGERACGPS